MREGNVSAEIKLEEGKAHGKWSGKERFETEKDDKGKEGVEV